MAGIQFNPVRHATLGSGDPQSGTADAEIEPSPAPSPTPPPLTGRTQSDPSFLFVLFFSFVFFTRGLGRSVALHALPAALEPSSKSLPFRPNFSAF